MKKSKGVVGTTSIQMHEPIGNPQRFIQQAIEKGSSIEHLERLMGLQERWQANQSRIAFLEAMSQFQNRCPVLEKTKKVAFGTTKYAYAPLGEIAATIKETMYQCGLSHRWEIKDTDTLIMCTCIISHRDGHSESTTMSAGKDASGSKNEIQQRGSTITYLQRYSLIAALGISTADEDNDAQTPRPLKPQPSTSEELVQVALGAIENAKNAGSVINIDKRASESPKFTPEQKTLIHSAASAKVEKFDAK